MNCPACDTPLPSGPGRCPGCNVDPESLFVCPSSSCGHVQELTARCGRCGTPLGGPLSGERIVWGKQLYIVRELIGGGGMGEVYRAVESDELGTYRRDVALKFNRNVTVEDITDRFKQEVQNLCRLTDPHNMRFYGYGEIRDKGRLTAQFMVMELLDGVTLEVRLGRGPMPWPGAVLSFRQIAGALAEVHSKGVIHRDLKPDNVMLVTTGSSRGFVKLFDFGLSKDTMTPVEKRLSTSGIILGTLWYMSPEQAQGEELTAASDVFSFGVILYQALTGRPPYPADNLFQLYRMHAQEVPALEVDVPEPLEALVERCLQVDPESRFQDGGALVAALDECATGLDRLGSQPPELFNDSSEAMASAPTLEYLSGELPAVGSSPRVGSSVTALAGQMTTGTTEAAGSRLTTWVVAVLITAVLVSGALAAWHLLGPPGGRGRTGTGQGSGLRPIKPTASDSGDETSPPPGGRDGAYDGISGDGTAVASAPSGGPGGARRGSSGQIVEVTGRSKAKPSARPTAAVVRSRRAAVGLAMAVKSRPSPFGRSPRSPLKRESQAPAVALPRRAKTALRRGRARSHRPAAQTRRSARRRTAADTRVMVSFDLSPRCRVFTLDGRGRSYPAGGLKMSPGPHTFVCARPSERLRRKGRFVVEPKRPHTVVRRWRKVRLKLLLWPWAYPYVDGFYYGDRCDRGCVTEVWSGPNEVVLKRPVAGMKGVRGVAYRKVVVVNPGQQRLLLRWGRKGKR